MGDRNLDPQRAHAGLNIRYQIFISFPMHKIVMMKGITVIMMSYNLNIVSMFADNMMLMSPPRIMKQTGIASEVIAETDVSDVYNVDYKII